MLRYTLTYGTKDKTEDNGKDDESSVPVMARVDSRYAEVHEDNCFSN